MKNVLILIELKMFFIIEFYKLLIQRRFNIKQTNIIYKNDSKIAKIANNIIINNIILIFMLINYKNKKESYNKKLYKNNIKTFIIIIFINILIVLHLYELELRNKKIISI